MRAVKDIAARSTWRAELPYTAAHDERGDAGLPTVAQLSGNERGDLSLPERRTLWVVKHFPDGFDSAFAYDLLVSPGIEVVAGQGYMFGERE